MKRKKPSDIISETQRRQLREAGYVVVGRFLSKKMMEAFNNKIAGYGSQAAWGRAVLASLREQGEPDEGTTPYRE